MTPVYDAENALDAHLVRQLLADAGIAAHVFGADLIGAVGELPAQGLVRVWVDDAALAQARALLQDWAAAPVPDEDELLRLAQGEPPEIYIRV